MAASLMVEPTLTLEAVYERYARQVWSYARALARRDVAEDVTAEAFLALARRMRERGAPEDPLGYLLVTVRSRVIDLARRRKAASLSNDVPAPGAAPAEEAERRDRIYAAVGSLPPDLAEAVALRIFAGLTLDAAARVAGIPRGTLESRYAAALERLAVLLREEKP